MLSPGCTPLLRSDPRSIGRYRILGRLGAGGMATVYLADADGFVALKLVHEHLAADAEFRGRFERETQLAARVPAHCTAALLDTGVHDDRPYLVTEYLAGTPLHRLIDTEGPLDPASLHNVAVGLAAGLTAIHDCDLVHRDIKPSNVVINRGGVRIIDFGIARTLDTTTDFTRSGFVMGSLGWTSPEQLDGRPPMPEMDVFAWGCVLAFAATGRHPFGGDDSVTRSWQILHGEPDLSGVPDTIADLVRAALDRDTEHRPTAQELLLGLVGGSGPVVKVASVDESTGAVRRTGAVREPGAVRRTGAAREEPGAVREPAVRKKGRLRWALLVGAVPVGLAVVVSLSSAAGGGGEPVRPPSTGAPTTTPTTGPTASGGAPAGNDQPANGTGPETVDTHTPAPTATGGASDAVPGEDGQSPGETDESKPKKSKKPKD